MDFSALEQLDLNDCGTKKDILFTLFKGKQLKLDFIFIDPCAKQINLRSPKSLVVLPTLLCFDFGSIPESRLGRLSSLSKIHVP